MVYTGSSPTVHGRERSQPARGPPGHVRMASVNGLPMTALRDNDVLRS